MNLKQNYNRDDFLLFLKVFIPEFSKDIRGVATNGLGVTKEVFYLGESPDLNLSVFELTHSSSADARVALATDGFKVMRNSATYRALIIYRSNDKEDWRLSLMTATPSVNKKGKVGQEFSNPRRFSFFLGPNAKVNTPNQFLIKQGMVKDFTELQKRFSLEVVNKEFYKQISENYIKLVGGMLGSDKDKKIYKAIMRLPSVPEQSLVSLEFAVRLIGRVIFCWFLREKKSSTGISLMPNDLLSLEAIPKYSSYYHQVLESIFFEVLNKETKSRGELYSSGAFSTIPYLNGGLFSPQENDYYRRSDEGQSIYHNTLVIPNEWFVDFFKTLETYNFTIDENTSFDEELSIDPEMLGRIFENLLAEINPETGESARKSTGSYYTPRTIVDYMVDESLLLYLKQKTNINEETLRAIISYDLSDDLAHPVNQDEQQNIINALEKLKLLDPACGSGAFPIGALQKIVFILQQIDQDGQLWFKTQIKKASPEIRRVIEREFSHKNFDYIRKLGIIRENIYGVDIQPIATEISRLRCFLTLVVDERVDDSLPNRGIEPLPNLDFKFVTANSLIGLPNNQQITLFKDQAGIGQLKDLRNQFFNATNSERYQLKDEFKEIQKKMLLGMIERRSGDEITQKLSAWDPFSNKTSSWFDPEWMFGIQDGFSILISNPPYLDSEGMIKNGLENLREYIAENYKYTKGNWDMYVAFFEKGIESLSSNGILAYISPDKWISKPFGEVLRESTLKYMYSILNAGRDVFENAKVDSIVTIFEMTEVANIKVLKIKKKEIIFQREYEKIKLKNPYALDFLFSDNLELLNKIEAHSKLSHFFKLNCENACATSDAYKLAPLLRNISTEDIKSGDYLKIINTGTIGKYFSKWGQREMVYLGKKYSSPGVLKEQFIKEFGNSYSKKSINPKIIIKGLNLLDACLDESGEIIPGKSTLMIANNDLEKLKLLLALINSSLAMFYLKEKHPGASYNQGTSFTKDMINNLPIPKISEAETQVFIKIVNKILEIGKEDDYSKDSAKKEEVKEYEKQINQVVYKLYDLTPEEIEVIENSNKK